jgi:F-type H+-transporting ATPase subunit b
LLVTVLAVKLRAPVSAYVNDRHVSLREELQRVRGLLVSAQRKYDEFSGKLKAMDAEILSLREQAKQDASAAKVRVVAEAQRLSATVIHDARVSAQGLYSQLKSELFSEVGLKVVDRAEKLLRERLTGDDRARIRKEFSSQVETVQ